MGKRAKSIRHVEKMKKRREEKRARNALYASQALSGKNKRRVNSKKAHLRIRDNKCKNIGDLRSNPEQAPAVWALWYDGQYRGRYKGVMEQVTKLALQEIIKTRPGLMAFDPSLIRRFPENIVRLTRTVLSV